MVIIGVCSTYSWQSTAWSACTKSCGTGTRTRTNTCVNQNGAVQTNTALCTSTKPTTIENCATNACPVYWWTSAWGVCSKNCEGGQMTRTIECRDQATDTSVSQSLCLSSQPSTIADCNIQHCPQWYPQDWGTCGARCGASFQNRTILCLDYLLREVPAVECIHNVPASVQPCQVIPCPHWQAGEYGTCSATCGGGVQDRYATHIID